MNMANAVRIAVAHSLFLILAAVAVRDINAQTPVTVTVDYSSQLGSSSQLASGFLHAVSANDPYQYLIDGVKVSQIRGMAYVSGESPGVTGTTEANQYQPNLFNPATYARVSATGAKLMVGLYYYVDAKNPSTDSYWPGDGGNQTTWRNTVAFLYNYSVINKLNVYSWLPWNEPNGQWNNSYNGNTRNTAAYYQAWLNAYQEIKILNSSALVQGPEVSSFNTSYIESFLSFCKTNKCLPDILSWHELTGSSPQDIESHTATIKAWMIANGITPMPLAVTEYAGGSYGDETSWSPGQLTTYIAKLERSSRASNLAFGVKSCWDYNSSNSSFIATLGDQADITTGSFPTGGWWVYNAYKDATGEAISETSSNTAVVDAFAAYDTNMWRSEIILGDPVGGASSNVTLKLKNLNDASSLMNNGTIHLRVETLTPGSNVYKPAVALEGDYASSGNAVTVTLPTLESQNSYRILVNSAIAAAPTTYYEAHLLPETNTAGVDYTTYTESGSRDGTATSLNATAIGDEITYTINVATAGVYDLRASLKSAGSHAMLQLYLNGVAVSGPKDEYNSTTGFYNEDFGNVNLPAGNSTLKFVAVNKNPSSSDYTMSFDYFELITLARN